MYSKESIESWLTGFKYDGSSTMRSSQDVIANNLHAIAMMMYNDRFKDGKDGE